MASELKFDLRKCRCGSVDLNVYCTGEVKQYFSCVTGKAEQSFFTSFDGYVVECDECGSVTRYQPSIDEAIEKWNNGTLAYDGSQDPLFVKKTV